MTEQVDVVVVGMGVGGEAVAGDLAEQGLSVVGIEGKLVGGECPYWGCIPSKMMIRAADLLAEARRIDGIAGTATVTPDWEPVARRTVAVGDRTFPAGRAIVLATGTEPAIPPIPGLADVPYWTNRDVVEAKELPS